MMLTILYPKLSLQKSQSWQPSPKINSLGGTTTETEEHSLEEEATEHAEPSLNPVSKEAFSVATTNDDIHETEQKIRKMTMRISLMWN
jgi:hypothetical protein